MICRVWQCNANRIASADQECQLFRHIIVHLVDFEGGHVSAVGHGAPVDFLVQQPSRFSAIGLGPAVLNLCFNFCLGIYL